MKKFIVERSTEVKTVFSDCTGGLALSATGLLDGLEATTNHFFIGSVAEEIGPKVRWNKQKNWVASGNGKYWTAAGAVTGMDMMGQWIRETFEKGQELLDLSTLTLEWRPRNVDGMVMRYVNGRNETVEV